MEKVSLLYTFLKMKHECTLCQWVCSFVYKPMCLPLRLRNVMQLLTSSFLSVSLIINCMFCTLTLHPNVAMLGGLVVLLRPHTAHDVISSSLFSLPAWPQSCQVLCTRQCLPNHTASVHIFCAYVAFESHLFFFL